MISIAQRRGIPPDLHSVRLCLEALGNIGFEIGVPGGKETHPPIGLDDGLEVRLDICLSSRNVEAREIGKPPLEIDMRTRRD